MGSRLPGIQTLRSRASHGLRAVLCCLPVLLALALPARAQAPAADEYSVKAAFLLNFASFTSWPDEQAEVLLCVYGTDEFGPHLEGLDNRAFGARHLRVRRTASADGLGDCNMVFITRPMIRNFNRVLDKIEGRPVLTVADSPGAMQMGVMLNMETLGDRIGFSANLGAARRQGVGLSSRLLHLATEVRQ